MALPHLSHSLAALATFAALGDPAAFALIGELDTAGNRTKPSLKSDSPSTRVSRFMRENMAKRRENRQARKLRKAERGERIFESGRMLEE